MLQKCSDITCATFVYPEKQHWTPAELCWPALFVCLFSQAQLLLCVEQVILIGHDLGGQANSYRFYMPMNVLNNAHLRVDGFFFSFVFFMSK